MRGKGALIMLVLLALSWGCYTYVPSPSPLPKSINPTSIAIQIPEPTIDTVATLFAAERAIEQATSDVSTAIAAAQQTQESINAQETAAMEQTRVVVSTDQAATRTAQDAEATATENRIMAINELGDMQTAIAIEANATAAAVQAQATAQQIANNAYLDSQRLQAKQNSMRIWSNIWPYLLTIALITPFIWLSVWIYRYARPWSPVFDADGTLRALPSVYHEVAYIQSRQPLMIEQTLDDYEEPDNSDKHEVIIAGLRSEMARFYVPDNAQFAALVKEALDPVSDVSLGQNDTARHIGMTRGDWYRMVALFTRYEWLRERDNQKPVITANGQVVFWRWLENNFPFSTPLPPLRTGV